MIETLAAPRSRDVASGGGARTLVLMGIVIVVLFGLGFGVLAASTSGPVGVSSAAFGFGTGVLALTLGMRHAFDADHIAAIDNSTRKLVADGKRPLAVGFFFSLGHSSVVFAMVVLLGFGIQALNLQVQDDSSALHAVTGVVGTTVSAAFLYLIAIINLVATVSIVRSFRRLRAGRFDEREFEAQLSRRGLINRLFGRAVDRIDASWKLYPLGALFGLGFDTATEVTLLVLSGASVVGGAPWWGILSLPLLFAAGMCLFDTADGAVMNLAYRWAFFQPARRVYFNVVITALSVAIALGVGTVEVLALLGERTGWTGAFWDAVGAIDLTTVGFAIVGLLVVTWLLAMLVWKAGRFDRRTGGPAADLTR